MAVSAERETRLEWRFGWRHNASEPSTSLPLSQSVSQSVEWRVTLWRLGVIYFLLTNTQRHQKLNFIISKHLGHLSLSHSLTHAHYMSTSTLSCVSASGGSSEVSAATGASSAATGASSAATGASSAATGASSAATGASSA
eukprot:Selendium_serpulae@DN4526_c0_g1_i1.p1